MDFPPRAEAWIGAPRAGEFRDCVAVHVEPIALAQDRAVPVHAECREVGELALLGAGANAIQIIDPQDEATTGRPRPQPCQECRAQVSDMEIARRRGGEAPRAFGSGVGGHIGQYSVNPWVLFIRRPCPSLNVGR